MAAESCPQCLGPARLVLRTVVNSTLLNTNYFTIPIRLAVQAIVGHAAYKGRLLISGAEELMEIRTDGPTTGGGPQSRDKSHHRFLSLKRSVEWLWLSMRSVPLLPCGP